MTYTRGRCSTIFGAVGAVVSAVALAWVLPGALQANQQVLAIETSEIPAGSDVVEPILDENSELQESTPAVDDQAAVAEAPEPVVDVVEAQEAEPAAPAPEETIAKPAEEVAPIEAESAAEAAEQLAERLQSEESTQPAAPVVDAVPEQALPQAMSVDLRQPLEDADHIEAILPPDPEPELATVEADQTAPDEIAPLVLLGTEVPALTSTRLSWSPAQSFEGLASPTSVLVVNGAKSGPTLCLTAAVHGDEINGVEIVRRVLYNIDPEDLSGSVIGVPIVNLQGFQRGSRYLPDRRDLNRYFPGSPEGSSAARIAYSFFHEIIEACTVLVDLHTGSFDRTNLPQLRADLSNEQVVEITQGFGATVVLHSEGAEGTLRRAAVNSGIPAVTFEAGGPMRLQEDAVDHSVKSIHTLLNHLGMVKKTSIWGDPEPVYYSSQWLRAETGGVLISNVRLGEKVKEGEVLGNVTNPITNVSTEVRAPFKGRVLGMAMNQVVLPGYAAYHLGRTAGAEEIPESAEDMDGSESSPSEDLLEEDTLASAGDGLDDGLEFD